ncbi:LysR family transcriptional regulator [Pseudorhodoferax sp. Leaf265]|uniref:LysR family transcriptional regulator n=1 Tax=Pseudorhodoferax sp. Leaf265 TaxID=1736315 RepID=UPI0006F5A9F9|nr:LysR family transcriptional regulator [Pseudorhodoferax sp. Leaf265]KQP06257.1 LysR family transcriptional regulator [Pseudorhodoferax sp. Leaf265]
MAERKRTEVDWQDVRVFLALGRYRSLSAAARALQVNHATIARRIQSLEGSMGEKLVERRPDGYLLTAAGERALEAATGMEAAAQLLTRKDGADDGDVRGVVRINAPPALAHAFLAAQLARVTLAHPGLDIDLATDLHAVSLDRRKADIAVRIGRPNDGDLIAQSVGKLACGFYGTNERCAEVEAGLPPVFISFDEQHSDMPEGIWLAQQFPRARVAFRAENQLLQATAARAGAGIALLPHYIARQLPGLRPCALTPLPPAREVVLLIRGQDRHARPIRTVMRHLVDAFKESRALFGA